MKEPRTPGEVSKLHGLLKSDPQEYLRISSKWIDENPNNAHAYYSRHLGWVKIGECGKALEDISKAIEIAPSSVDFMSRGNLYRHLGQYENALADYDQGEAMDTEDWARDGLGLLYQAEAHARLGNEEMVVAHCERLPDDFWTPGIQGTPSGRKAEIAEKLRAIAVQVKRRQ